MDQNLPLDGNTPFCEILSNIFAASPTYLSFLISISYHKRHAVTIKRPCNIPQYFKMKNSYVFLSLGQNIDCGYTLEPSQCGSNEY